MDIGRAHAALRTSSSTHGHRRLGERTARIDPVAFGETADDDDDGELGVEMEGRRMGGRRDQSPSPDDFPDDFPDEGGMDDGTRPPRRPGGYIASRHRAEKRIARENFREKVRIAASTPKAVEAALKEQRERARKRKRVKAMCPNPVRGVRDFCADPVRRFWCGCNIFCTLFLFIGAFTFMSVFYPVLLRPTLKY